MGVRRCDGAGHTVRCYFSGSGDHPQPWQAEIWWQIAFGVSEPRQNLSESGKNNWSL